MQTARQLHSTGCRLQPSRPVASPRPCSIQQTRLTARQQQQQHWQHTPRSRRLQLVQAEPFGTTTTTTATSSSSSSNGADSSSVITDSDISFLGKLLAFSFAGAALIKYGSLLIELPFQPNAAVALSLVLGTPAAYSLYLLTKGGSSSSQQ